MEGLILFLVYGAIAVVVVGFGFLFYVRSVASRKRYVCPQCGEQQTVELMDASHCNACGAPFAGNTN